jgi:hypothetical protein
VHRFILCFSELWPDAEALVVMACAACENLYVLIWWPDADAVKIWPRALGAMGHFFLALDAVLCANAAISSVGSFVIGRVIGLTLPGVGMAITIYAASREFLEGDSDDS